MEATLSRRTLVTGGTAAAFVGLISLGTESPANAAEVLPGFPAGIKIYREVFKNWDGVVVTAPLWTCVPRHAADVVAVTNWAAESSYSVRARGYRHTWSPLTVEATSTSATQVILVDTTKNLTGMSIPAKNRVRVAAGARMDTLLEFLHRNGYTVSAAPAPGDITVGGALAVSGHGTAVWRPRETPQAGQTMGTMSNLITSVTAVVWDEAQGAYVARTFDRGHPDAKAFLTGIGRTFLLEVELQVMPDYNIRCRNRTDISTDVLFASPETAGSLSLSSLLDANGRVGLIWYAFTKYPWVQTWTVTPKKPLFSRRTYGPYNYPFADNIPSAAAGLLGQLVSGKASVAPAFGKVVLAATQAGLLATHARDMWGPAKNFINFVKPTTLKVSAGSHGVVTSRANVQRVVHEFYVWYTAKIEEYKVRRQFPVNSCVEIRVTGVDTPAEVGVAGAEAPALSAARPVDGHPEYDTVVWLDVLTLPGTPHEFAFFAELEAFTRTAFAEYAVARPEWAKRWATTAAGPWTDAAVIEGEIPAVFPEWEWVRDTFDRYDPQRLFSNPLLDRLMPRR